MIRPELARRAVGFFLAAAMAGLFSLAGPPATPPPSGALTNEAIVRMIASGVPEKDVIARIRAATKTEFDLDPEIVAEMRLAGVSPAVIEAMRTAQPRALATPPPSANAPEAPVPARLVVRFHRAPDGSDDIEGGTAVLPAVDPSDRPIRLAFYVICTLPMHVPDFWERRTPLSPGFGRHHLIDFNDSVSRLGRPGRPQRIALDLPAERSMGLEASEHWIELGVAARSGDAPWQPIAALGGVPRFDSAGEARLEVKISTARPRIRGSRTAPGRGIRVELLSADPEAPFLDAHPESPDPPRPPGKP